MGIELGLTRIEILLRTLGNPHRSTWRAIHIAGTNGKGSICSYLSSIFSCSMVKVGKFTSPHLVNVNDSIMISGKPVLFDMFGSVMSRVKAVDEAHNIKATEFELLTAVAFEIFRIERVKLAIIEVGLGGRLDSTNILPPCEKKDQSKVDWAKYGVLATGISKISMDHENILGSTIEAIAREKAGIIKPQVPCVIDGSNPPEVLNVVKHQGVVNKSQVVVEYLDNTSHTFKFLHSTNLDDICLNKLQLPLLGSYQYNNLSVALRIVDLVNSMFEGNLVTTASILEGIRTTKWPGRVQKLNFKPSTAESFEVLLDGAHNESAALELQKFINSEIRCGKLKKQIVFVISMTSSKDITKVLKPLLSKSINDFDDIVVYLTNFDSHRPVAGMPWIKSYNCNILREKILQTIPDLAKTPEDIKIQPDLKQLLQTDLLQLTKENSCSVVVCGSLYLVGEVLRTHLNNGGDVSDVY